MAHKQSSKLESFHNINVMRGLISSSYIKYTLLSFYLVLLATTVLWVWPCLISPANAAELMHLYAVIVGVTKFQDTSIDPLQLSTKDAKDFAALIAKQATLFAESPDITLLLDEQATRYNITAALRQKLKKAGKEDVVILYFSGHGATDPDMPDEFYFVTHDANKKNLFATALLMNDTRLFRSIQSERFLMIADTCFSGGFRRGIEAPKAKSIFSLADSLKGRRIFTSSSPWELSWEDERFDNSVFTHFLLKGLRGCADLKPRDGVVTIQELYNFVAGETKAHTKERQNPMIFPKESKDDDTPIFRVKKFDKPLKVKVQFQYQDAEGKVRSLTGASVLKSDTPIGVSFKPSTDCHVYIFWWDSSGNVGRLFPNPKLTGGEAFAKGGTEHWLPAMENEARHDRWYVLDEKPGDETIYFVASRSKNQELEQLYGKLSKMVGKAATNNSDMQRLKTRLKREINLMGFRDYTINKNISRSYSNRKDLFNAMQDSLQSMAADFVYSVKFKHISH